VPGSPVSLRASAGISLADHEAVSITSAEGANAKDKV
jgi:hypothetical protein